MIDHPKIKELNDAFPWLFVGKNHIEDMRRGARPISRIGREFHFSVKPFDSDFSDRIITKSLDEALAQIDWESWIKFDRQDLQESFKKIFEFTFQLTLDYYKWIEVDHEKLILSDCRRRTWIVKFDEKSGKWFSRHNPKSLGKSWYRFFDAVSSVGWGIWDKLEELIDGDLEADLVRLQEKWDWLERTGEILTDVRIRSNELRERRFDRSGLDWIMIYIIADDQWIVCATPYQKYKETETAREAFDLVDWEAWENRFESEEYKRRMASYAQQ